MNRSRRVHVLLLNLACTAIAAAGPVPADPAVAAILEKNCVSCHNAKKSKGEFRMDNLPLDFTDPVSAERWAQVRFRMNTGEMPPEDEDPVSPEDLGRVTEWISGRVDEGRAARLAKRVPVEHYRLSRDEYANTVQDLLGVTYDVKAPGALNEDPRWHGYENIGAMLTLSPSHVDRYYKAAETVLERAFPDTPPKSVTYRADAVEIRYKKYRPRIDELGLATKARVALWPAGDVSALEKHWPMPKVSGVYRAKVRLSGLPGPDGRAPHLSIWDPQLKRSLFDEDIIAPEDQPVTIEFETFLDLPTRLELRNEVPRAFKSEGNHNFNVTDHGDYGIFTTSKDHSMINPTAYQFFDDGGNAIHPMLLIDYIEWEGPLTPEADLAKRREFVPVAETEAAARQALQRLATRAWRRPVPDAEIDRYAGILGSELAAGEKFPAALRTAMLGILTSKNFYYIREGSPGERRDRLDGHELATRLSYFLWRSMPDAALTAAAENGSLRSPEGLRSQLARMIADPRARRFTEAFPRQWLQLHNVGVFPPDPTLYPDYDLWLEKSMILETTGYFAGMFQENLPLREFLSSDWTLANPRLASFYGFPQLTKSGFQKVHLPPGSHRGGLLTQAAVLMLTSDGTRHRPVHRGVWVSEAIFGKTPPPPPPNVDPIEPLPDDKPKATIRQQLEVHATHPTCASCHRNIDPLGFAFENYNAIGQWRTEEVIPRGKGANPPVDASGTLPGDRSYDGPEAFKKLLGEDIDRFAEAFTGQLATFALRRIPTFDDRTEIAAIARTRKKDDYRLRSLVEALVLSDLFQKR